MAKIGDIKNYIRTLNEQYVTDGSSALAIEVKEPIEEVKVKVNPIVTTIVAPEPVKEAEIKEDNSLADKIGEIINSLVEGVDYGTIPKVNGNVLFKKGALKIIKMMGYKHTMSLVDKSVDIANNFIGYTVKVSIVDTDGSIVTEAFGSANTLETKFSGKGFGSDSMLIGMASKRALVECAKELLLC